MTNEDDIPFEILSPTPGMAEVLLELRMRLDLWTKSDASPAVAHVWEDLPLQAFSAELARYPLILSGLGEGGAAAGSVPEADLYHRLSQELGIMSTDDLKTEFLDRVEGRHTAADFRRVQEAASIDDLVRNDMALGWSGFEITPKDDALVERARRERMFADYFRGALNWTHLRAWDIARAAALAEEARAAEMIDEVLSASFATRTSGEALVRFSSWHAWARSLITARVWLALEERDRAALETLRREEKLLDGLLEGPWKRFPWPRLKAMEH